MSENALIVGVGPGLSASLARLFHKEKMNIVLASRNVDRLADLCAETGARAYACDVSDPQQVAALFDNMQVDVGSPDIVVYNPSARARGPFAELDPDEVARAVTTTAMGGFHVAQNAVQHMLKSGGGTILFTGASASVKGYPQSAPFAMGKFAIRGLAQSMARELAPKNIHVAHFVIDGGIRRKFENAEDPEQRSLDPDAIAQSYLHVLRQDRSAWTWEVELRPWTENF